MTSVGGKVREKRGVHLPLYKINFTPPHFSIKRGPKPRFFTKKAIIWLIGAQRGRLGADIFCRAPTLITLSRAIYYTLGAWGIRIYQKRFIG